MYRSNYTPPAKTNAAADLAATLLAIVLIGFLLSHVGPAMDGVLQEIDDEQAAQVAAQKDARYAKAAGDQCGGPEATWIEVAPGVVDCYNKDGRRTAINRKVRL